MDTSELSSRISTILSATPGVCLAYLFGSQVDGTPGPLSDVDLGIVLADAGDKAALRALLAHEVGKQVRPLSVDVILLAEAPVELAYAVIARGMCIFQQDTLTRVEFEAGIMSRYGDYLPVLREQRRAILEEGGHDRRVQRYRAALRRTERTLEQIRAAQTSDRKEPA